MGRGGNARFHTFQLDHHGSIDGRMDQRTDKASYRVACPQLKIERPECNGQDQIKPDKSTWLKRKKTGVGEAEGNICVKIID